MDGKHESRRVSVIDRQADQLRPIRFKLTAGLIDAVSARNGASSRAPLADGQVAVIASETI